MKAKYAIGALAIFSIVAMLFSQMAFALPSPITFQRSVPFSVFNSASATVYDVTATTKAPFEVSIVDSLTYSVQSPTNVNNKSVIKIQSAKTGSMNALEIIQFEDKAIDISWTDKVTGTTTKIGGALAADQNSYAKELLIENTGTTLSIRDITNNKAIIENFVLPSDFSIVAVSAYGETDAVTDGFKTVYLGGLNPSKMVSINTNSMIPLVMAIVTIGIVLGVFTKIGKRI